MALSAGLVAFAVGQLGNLYHHVELARMRKGGKASERYVMPTGGLFDLVTMPHYLFEITAWFGLAIVTQQVRSAREARRLAV